MKNAKIGNRLVDQVNKAVGQYGSALQAASSAGWEDIVPLLLENGADVNAQGTHCSA
jgi:hypothetical protein